MNIYINDVSEFYTIKFRVDGVLKVTDINAGCIHAFEALGIKKNEIQKWADDKLEVFNNQFPTRPEYLINCLKNKLADKGLL